MPQVMISTNISKNSIDTDAVICAVTKTISIALNKPEATMLVQLELDLPMRFLQSNEPVVFAHVRSIGEINSERNPDTIKTLTATLVQELDVASERVAVFQEDIPASNWGMNGAVVVMPSK